MKKNLLYLLLILFFSCPALAGVAATAPTITSHPMPCHTILGTMAKFSVTAIGTEPLRYQWQSLNNDGIWSDIAGANSADYSFITTFITNREFCRVMVSNGYGSATSNSANLSVIEIMLPVPLITIVTQPAKNTKVTEGSIIGSLSVDAYISPSGTLSYQWYSNTVNSNMDGTLIPGATNANFTISKTLKASNTPYYYYCLIDGSAPENSPLQAYEITEVAAIMVVKNSDDDITSEDITSEDITSDDITSDDSSGGCNNIMIGEGMLGIFVALSILFVGQKKRLKKAN